jgi:hypothetical protein
VSERDGVCVCERERERERASERERERVPIPVGVIPRGVLLEIDLLCPAKVHHIMNIIII